MTKHHENEYKQAWKRKTLRAFTALTLAAALAVGPVQVTRADSIWDLQKAANEYTEAGNLAAAVPYWTKLVDHFLSVGDSETVALYAGRLGKYYDSQKDYEKAIYYYELENEHWLKHGTNWGAADAARADEIRTILELYVSTDEEDTIRELSAPKSGGLSKFEPESGMYIGLYSEPDPLMGNLFRLSEQFYNKKHAIYLAYAIWGQPFPSGHAARAKEAGGALQIGLQPDDGLDEVTDTKYIRDWAKAAKAAGIPIFLRYASEMNGDWTAWHDTPEKYIEKFRLVHRIMAEEAPNVAMVWSPNDVPRFTMSAYYPGDEYVDWVGVSLYTEPYANGNPSEPGLGTTPVERLDEIYKLYADRKPIMISETAVSHYTHRDAKSWTGWSLANLDRLYQVMPKKYPRLKAITYFNKDMKDQDSRNNYLLRDNAAMMEAYKSMIASPYYISKVETGAKPAAPIGYAKAEGNVSFAKKAHIVPFVKIPDVYIGRVVYTLNGVTVAAQTQAPFGIELEAGNVPEGSVLEVDVYDAGGARVVSRTVGINSEVSVNIDGKDYKFEQPAVIRDGSTLAPVRAIFNALGAEVDWNPDTRTATGRKGAMTVSITIGSNEVKRGSETAQLDVPAQLVNGFTMVPARFVGEAFGGKVTWDGKTRTVKITTQ